MAFDYMNPMAGAPPMPDYSQYQQEMQGYQQQLQGLEAGGYQSVMKSIFMPMLLGMASAGAADNPGSAMAAGYMGVMQAKENERQQILEHKKMAQQEYMFEAQMANNFLQKLKLEQEIEQMPIELQQKMRQNDLSLLDIYARSGNQLLGTTPLTPEAMEEAIKANGGKINFIPASDGKMGYMMRPDAVIQQDEEIQLPHGGTQVFPAGTSIADIAKIKMDAAKEFMETERTRLQRESMEKIAAGNNAATIAASQNRQAIQPGEITDQQKSTIYGIDQKINDLDQQKSIILRSVEREIQDSEQPLPPQEIARIASERTAPYDQKISALQRQREMVLNPPRPEPKVGAQYREGTFVGRDNQGRDIYKQPNGRLAVHDARSGKLIYVIGENDWADTKRSYNYN